MIISPTTISFLPFSIVHSIDHGAARFVNALDNKQFQTGGFYASEESKVTGQVKIHLTLADKQFQDNVYTCLHQYE